MEERMERSMTRFGKSELFLINAEVITQDAGRSRAEAVAVSQGRISAVGSNSEVLALARGKRSVVDCGKKTLLPGFIDPHIHLFAFAESVATLALSPRAGVRSIGDILGRVHEKGVHLPPGAWIRGMGYNEHALSERRHPNRWDLDRVSPLHPVKLTHRTGHAHVLNSLALKQTGISTETADPPGGMIDRAPSTGEPTGVLFEMGRFLSGRIPRLGLPEIETGMAEANRQLLQCGITSILDVSHQNDIGRLDRLRKWGESGVLNPRVSAVAGSHLLGDAAGMGSPVGVADRSPFPAPGVKIILDETTGELLPVRSELNRMVLYIHRAGLQALIHAVEEKAVETALGAIAYALSHNGPTDHRHRVEHCALCTPALARRLASLGVIVVTQPAFLYYNGEQYLRSVPIDQQEFLYPIRTLMESGVCVAASSDGPVIPVNPLIGVYAACARMTEAGGTVSARERIRPADALTLFTTCAARSFFREGEVGSVAPGKAADLVMISRDPTRIPVEEIAQIEVLMTMIGGEVVWGGFR